MEVEIVPTAEEAAQRCAAVLAAEILAGARQIALTGGTSPVRAYELLGPIVPDWKGVELWYGDERCVPPEDEQSNHRQATATLEAPGAHWHRMPGELGPEEGAAAYASELGDTVLDIVLLGMGPDGHVASLMPGLPGLRAGGRVIGVRDSPKPPPERISLSFETINGAGRIVLLVTGEAKRVALARALDLDAEPTEDVPASMLAHDRLLVLADREALPG